MSHQKLLERILEKEIQHSIEEISLYKASREMKMAYQTLLKKAESGDFPARKYNTKKAKCGYSFMVKVIDLHNFQLNEQRKLFLKGIAKDKPEINISVEDSIKALTEKLHKEIACV